MYQEACLHSLYRNASAFFLGRYRHINADVTEARPLIRAELSVKALDGGQLISGLLLM
jgi:hypothetical protein